MQFMFNNSKKLAFVCLLTMIAGSILLDQLTKSWATDKFMTWQHAENLMAYHGRYEELLSVPSSASESKDVSWYLKFGFNYVRNQGAAWGMFSDMNDRVRVPFFYLITILATCVILMYWKQTPASHRLVRFSLALIFSGAVGNFIDRFRLGFVTDFIDVRWKIPLPFRLNFEWNFFPDVISFLNMKVDTSFWQYDFPKFNWADSMITIGVSLMIIDMLFFEKKRLANTQQINT